jgi:hypothetical protein
LRCRSQGAGGSRSRAHGRLVGFRTVVGFIVSAIPAVGLALTVSGQTAAIVWRVHPAQPRRELSDLSVGLRQHDEVIQRGRDSAFLVGAQLAGVIGALIALPIAAIYPIERVWLRGSLPEETVQEHRAPEAGKAV